MTAANSNTYTVSYEGKRSLVSIRVDPSSVNLIGQQTVQYHCYAIYSDGTEEDVTNEATWSHGGGPHSYSNYNYLYWRFPSDIWGYTKYIRCDVSSTKGNYTYRINDSGPSQGSYQPWLPSDNMLTVNYGGLSASVRGYMQATAVEFYVNVPGSGWQNGTGPYLIFPEQHNDWLERIWGDAGTYYDLYDSYYIGATGSTATWNRTVTGVTSNSVQVVAGDYRLSISFDGNSGESWGERYSIWYDLPIDYYDWIPEYGIYWTVSIVLAKYSNGVLDPSFTPIDVTGSCEIEIETEGLKSYYNYQNELVIVDESPEDAEALIDSRVNITVVYKGVEYYCHIDTYVY